MDLLEIKEKRKISREQAAKLLHQVADALERQNKLNFEREGLKLVVDVANQVDFELELEVGDDNSLEIEISW